MPRAGRPRQRREVEELRASSEAERKRLVEEIWRFRKKATSFDYAWAAATILHTLEKPKLSSLIKAICEDGVSRLRKTHCGAAVDPCRKMPHAEFLETFIRMCAPGWNWRTQALTKEQTEERQARDERYIQELARTQRDSRAHANRHVLPEGPDPSRLIFLASRIRPNDRMTWATLRELKLATGLSERNIRNCIIENRPKESELVLKTPRRFGPRLVLAVIEDFLRRLPSLEIDKKMRNDCIAGARQLQKRLMIGS